MAVEVRDAPERSRYEMYDDGQLAGFAAYADAGRLRVFTHTEVDDRFAGRGLGSALVRGALDDTRGQGRSVLPVCPFVRGYVERHPEYADAVAAVRTRVAD